MTDPPPIRSTISTSPRGRGKLGMTYGNEQIGLELCNTFRGLPDEFMDVVVGGFQVWRFLCHLPLSRRSVQEIKVVRTPEYR